MNDDIIQRRGFLGTATMIGLGVGALAGCDPGPGPEPVFRNGTGETSVAAGAIDPSTFAGTDSDKLDAAIAAAGPGDAILIDTDYQLDRAWVISGKTGVTILGARGRIYSSEPVAIDMVDCEQCSIRGLAMDGAGGTAIHFGGSSLWCSVDRCEVDGFHTGVWIEGNAQHEVYVQRSRFTTQDIAGSRGIYLDQAVDHAVIGNVIRGFERGIDIAFGTSHRILANHIYRWPSAQGNFHRCLSLNQTYGHVITSNMLDNASEANLHAYGCWGLNVFANKFQSQAENHTVPLVHMHGPAGHQMWNVGIIANIFQQFGGSKKDDPITYSAAVNLDGSRNHRIRDNQFLNVRPVATAMTIRENIASGAISKQIETTNAWRKLVGPVGACQVSSKGPEFAYLHATSSTSVTIRLDSNVPAQRAISLDVSSRLEELT